MRSVSLAFSEAALPIVQRRVDDLRMLGYKEAFALPEAEGSDLLIGGMKASFTVFRYSNAWQLEEKILVVVLAARSTMFGMGAQHVERGLVFARGSGVRDATDLELQNSGG
jgi:hypothetical protein